MTDSDQRILDNILKKYHKECDRLVKEYRKSINEWICEVKDVYKGLDESDSEEHHDEPANS